MKKLLALLIALSLNANAQTLVRPLQGGTGVSNANTKTITLGGALVTSGAFTTTITVTGATGVTLPTSGTLCGSVVGCTLGAALTYGGVTLSNAVSGTGNMVLGTNPTLTGILSAAQTKVIGAFSKNTGDETQWGLWSQDATAMASGVGGGLLLRGVYTSGGALTMFGAIAGAKQTGVSGNLLGDTVVYASNSSGVLVEGLRVVGAATPGVTIPGTLGVGGDSILSGGLRQIGTGLTRIENTFAAVPTGATGPGVEIGISSGGRIQAYNRTSAALIALTLVGDSVALAGNAGVGLTLSNTGAVTVPAVTPHSIGGIARSFSLLALGATSTFTGTGGESDGLVISPTLAPSAGDSSYALQIANTINKAGSGTHADFATAILFPPAIGAGAATLTNATTLKITGAPSVGTNQRAIWVVGGTSQFDGGATINALTMVDDSLFSMTSFGNVFRGRSTDFQYYTPTAGNIRIINQANTQALFIISNAGLLAAPILGASTTWVSGDKYLVIDASGNIHRSAIGPGS